jgi:hypothetical protein
VFQSVYQLRIHRHGPTGERFVSFENAATTGADLARGLHVRLLYREHDADPPHLLKDFRPPSP